MVAALSHPVKYLSLLFLIVAGSCVQPVDISIEESHLKEPVLSGLLEVNSEMPDILRLNSTGSVTSTESTIPSIDQASFFSNGTIVSETHIDSNGYITVPAGFPGSGVDYEVVVELTDNSTVSAVGRAPMPPLLGGATFQQDGTLNSYGEQIRLLTVEITDPPGVDNYYELILFYYNPSIPRDVNKSISYYNQIIYPNNILASEGDQEYLPKSMFFSDELFDGQIIKFEQHIESNGQAGNLDSRINAGLDDEGLYLQIRSINSAYYSFLKSWTRHRYTQDLGTGFGNFSDITIERLQDVIFAPEPTPLISNVTGGLGVVGAAYTQIVKLQ